MNSSGSGDFCFERLLIIDTIYLVGKGLFRSSISSCMSLADVSFKRWVYFIQIIKFMGLEWFIVFPYYLFNVHGMCSDGVSFISHTSNCVPFFSWLACLKVD